MRKFDETTDVNSSHPDEREPWLVISSAQGVRGLPLPRSNRVVVGRMPTCDIVIDDDSVSRQHAAVIAGPQGLTIEDLGSRNKTRVGGRSLGRGETAPLPVGAVVEVGYATMFVQMGRPPNALRDPRRGGASASIPTGIPSSIPSTAIVQDPTMQRLYALLDVIAPSPLNVVILGETGTGKEVFAEAMHKGSTRASKPFLKINCASLSGSLLESELFGHEKGAFTGAIGAKEGLFEAANGGTVFLDEVGELPIETQAKLLRVIEYGEVLRLGSVQPRRVDVRYVAATNRDIDHAIAANRFRSDLFFRLNGFSMTLPPLRKRPQDIMPLARHFLERVARGRPYTVTAEAQSALMGYSWPGNVRELKNVLERACVLAGATGIIDPIHLHLPEAPRVDVDSAVPAETIPPIPYGSGAIAGTWPPPGGSIAHDMSAGSAGPGNDLKAQRGSWEKQQILQALEKTSGNQKEAAVLLGVSRRTLINKIEAYGIARPRKR
jgi:transcriptional regulator with GAF, ATPase, and Fis domain